MLKKIRQNPEKFVEEEGGWGAFFDNMNDDDQELQDPEDSEFESDFDYEIEDENDSEFDEEDLVDDDEELEDLNEEEVDEGKLIR